MKGQDDQQRPLMKIVNLSCERHVYDDGSFRGFNNMGDCTCRPDQPSECTLYTWLVPYTVLCRALLFNPCDTTFWRNGVLVDIVYGWDDEVYGLDRALHYPRTREEFGYDSFAWFSYTDAMAKFPLHNYTGNRIELRQTNAVPHYGNCDGVRDECEPPAQD